MTQPPYEPPHQPPVPPPGYGAPLPPPAPKKSRTGLIIGVVVGALVAIAAIVLAVVLVAGSDEDSDESSSGAESEEGERPDGEVLQGDGYSYVLPEDWTDITEAVTAQDTAGTIDSASAPGESLETTSANLIVESGDANGETDLESARDQVAANLGVSIGATPEEIDGPTIDGEETVGLQVTQSNAADVEVLQDAYVAIRGDTYYVIGFSRDATKDDFDDDLQALLDSWVWE
jgi:hypothetical protein